MTNVKHKGGHGKRSLSNKRIAYMIELYIAGGYTTRQLAERFGITHSAVSYYVRKFYYGQTKGPTREIIRESKLNTEEE